VLAEVQSSFNFQSARSARFKRESSTGCGGTAQAKRRDVPVHKVHRRVQRVFGGSGPFPVAENMEQVHASRALMHVFTFLKHQPVRLVFLFLPMAIIRLKYFFASRPAIFPSRNA